MTTVKTRICDFDDLNLTETINKIKILAKSDTQHTLITPNIDHMARLITGNNKELIPIYQSASLCLCDSKILQKLMLLKGILLENVIPGSSLTEELFNNNLQTDDKIVIIGGDQNVITKLKAQYSELIIEHYNPPMGFINNETEVNKTINFCIAKQPEYIFLAVGSPRQEILAQKLKDTNKTTGVALCIGASILFLVDEEKRAPEWMQKAHIEWLYRMMQDPKRLVARYWSNFLKLLRIYKKI